MGAVAPQNHQTIQLEGGDRLFHGGHLIHPILPHHAHELEGLPGGSQYGAPPGEDAGEILRLHPPVIPADQALITVDEAVNLHLVERLIQRLRHPADRRVESLAVAAAG